MIKSAAVSDAPIACPACGTAWDYKQQPCRICAKDIDWAKYQRESHKKAHRMKFLERKERLAKARKDAKAAEEERLLQLAMAVQSEPSMKRRCLPLS